MTIWQFPKNGRPFLQFLVQRIVVNGGVYMILGPSIFGNSPIYHVRRCLGICDQHRGQGPPTHFVAEAASRDSRDSEETAAGEINQHGKQPSLVLQPSLVFQPTLVSQPSLVSVLWPWRHLLFQFRADAPPFAYHSNRFSLDVGGGRTWHLLFRILEPLRAQYFCT